MSLRIPPLLEPYLALPPEASLIVLTNVLGASSNWLVLRHLYSYLRGSAAGLGSGDGSGNGETDGVVLVSFLRDGAFWKDGAGRLVSGFFLLLFFWPLLLLLLLTHMFHHETRKRRRRRRRPKRTCKANNTTHRRA